MNTLYSLVLGIVAYFITYFLFMHLQGWWAIILRSVVFSGLMIGGIFIFKLTPDARQLLEVARKKLVKE